MTTAVDVLKQYKIEPEERPRLEYIVAEAEKYLPLLDSLDFDDNLGRCNAIISAEGHEELYIADPINLPPLEFVPDPTKQSQIGLFRRGFYMFGGKRASGDERGRIPMDSETLQELIRRRVGPKAIRGYSDHRARPAYYRAACLMPGFMVNLTVEISSAPDEESTAIFGPEIFLAYRVMSKLVDSRDRGALQPNGNVNRGYLFTRHVSARAGSAIAHCGL